MMGATMECELTTGQRLMAESRHMGVEVKLAADRMDELEQENAQLRELVRDYHRFADAMCAERNCDGCSQRDDGACERAVLTSRECVLEVPLEVPLEVTP